MSAPEAKDPLNDNESPGDGAYENDLTEERDATPEQRADVADTQAQDP